MLTGSVPAVPSLPLHSALRIHIRDAHLSVPAWHNEPVQVKLKIMTLPEDQRNFTRKLPYNKQVARFDYELFKKCAKASMAAQPELASVYAAVVPAAVTDVVFWSNYAFRVNCIVEAFYSQPNLPRFRVDFDTDQAYGQYVRATLVVPGTKVVACKNFADVKEGDIGTFISNDEPFNPPVQIRFDRLDALRFLPWEQIEIAATAANVDLASGVSPGLALGAGTGSVYS